MKTATILAALVLSIYSYSFAGDGAFQGTGIIEMKADESICIKIKPKGQQEQIKCFEKGDEGYQEIRSKLKDMKPGEIRKIEEID